MKCVVSEHFTHLLNSSIYFLTYHGVYLSAFLYIALLLLENVISQHQVFGKNCVVFDVLDSCHLYINRISRGQGGRFNKKKDHK